MVPCMKRFHLNRHTIEFHPHTRKVHYSLSTDVSSCFLDEFLRVPRTSEGALAVNKSPAVFIFVRAFD